MTKTTPLAVCALALPLLSACGGGAQPAATPAPATVTVTATPSANAPTAPSETPHASATSSTTARTSASATPTARATDGQTAAARACTSEELKVEVGESDGAGSRTYRKLTFTNASDHSCTLKGAPKVQANSASDPKVITTAEVDGEPRSFVVKPGGRAESTVSIGSAGAYADCVKDRATSLLIWDGGPQAPGSEPYAVPARFEFCRNMSILRVTPYKPA